MSNLNEEIVDRLVNSKNEVLYNYGLKNLSMEKLIDLFLSKKTLSSSEVNIISERLLAERDTDIVKKNSHMLLKFNDEHLLENIVKVSSLKYLEKGLIWIRDNVNLCKIIRERLRYTPCEEDERYVREKAVKFLFCCNKRYYNSYADDIIEKCIQTIVNVSSTSALLSTLSITDYMQNKVYVDKLIKKLIQEKDTDIVKEKCNELYGFDFSETRLVIASIAPIDILEKMIDVEESDLVARAIISRLEELSEENQVIE